MDSRIAFGGIAIAKPHLAPRVSLWWKIKNLPNILRGWRIAAAKVMNIPTYYGTLHARKFGADGSVVNYGLISARVVTTAFVELMVDQLITETSVWGDFKYHDSGIGTGSEVVGDTGLGTQCTTQTGDERFTGTQVEGASTNIYKSVATITYDGAAAITEHGLFNNTRGSGTLLDRSLFAVINVGNGDSIEFTYNLTCTAGG